MVLTMTVYEARAYSPLSVTCSWTVFAEMVFVSECRRVPDPAVMAIEESATVEPPGMAKCPHTGGLLAEGG